MRNKFERFLKIFRTEKDTVDDVEYQPVTQSLAPEEVEKVEIPTSACRELVLVTNESAAEQLANRAQLTKLEEEIKIFEAGLKSLNDEFDWMNRELSFTFHREIAELKALHEELEYLFNQRIQHNRNENGDDVAEEPEDLTVEDQEELDRLEAEMMTNEEREQSIAAHNEQIEMKKLLRQITMRTHPDRIKDKRLNAFFDEAIKAYASQDYEALLSIWSEMQHKGSSLWQKLSERIQHLTNKLMKTKMEYIELKSSNDYRMLQDFKTFMGRESVERHFERRVRASIKNAIEAIQSIDPERHRPPPAQSHDGFKAQTKTVLNEDNGNELESPWPDDQ